MLKMYVKYIHVFKKLLSSKNEEDSVWHLSGVYYSNLQSF